MFTTWSVACVKAVATVASFDQGIACAAKYMRALLPPNT
jgi:hypothetical protein